jgi:hypothetical protein
MKKISSRRNIKFALFLTTASILGAQGSHAIVPTIFVPCPQTKDIHPIKNIPNNHHQYTAKAVGEDYNGKKRSIIFTSHESANRVIWGKGHALGAHKNDTELRCEYQTLQGHVSLFAEDAGALHDCKPSTGGDAGFSCKDIPSRLDKKDK